MLLRVFLAAFAFFWFLIGVITATLLFGGGVLG